MRRQPSSNAQRGAALLILIYLTTIIFLVYIIIGVRRTFTHLHAAARSRELQQTFWLAEGALDVALTQLNTEQRQAHAWQLGDTAAIYELAEEQGVFLLPGACFGNPGFIRLGFGGATATLEKALPRVAEKLRQHCSSDLGVLSPDFS